MFKSLLRVPVLGRVSPVSPVILRNAGVAAVRFNSTKSDNKDAEPLVDSAKEVEQVKSDAVSQSAEEVAEMWLETIRGLRKQIREEGLDKPVEKPKSEYFKKYGIDPTPEQIAKAESLKDKPIPLKHDPIVEHCTNMIMKDGKKARAQRVMANALYIVKLQLRKDPIEVLKEILDKMSPLMAIRTQKSRAAKSVVMPVPLTERQRHRTAFLWILEGADKRRSPDFEVRLGEELVAAYQGRSSGYDKRLQIHKTAMLQRAYIKLR